MKYQCNLFHEQKNIKIHIISDVSSMLMCISISTEKKMEYTETAEKKVNGKFI